MLAKNKSGSGRCRFLFSSYHALIFILSLFWTASLCAYPWLDQSEISSGHHTFLSLQKESLDGPYYRKVHVEPIEGAKLIVFNHRLAESIGLNVPSDWRALEAWVLKHFAYKVAPKGGGAKTWFSSYYHGMLTNDPGRSKGDGRAAFTGEIVHVTKSGEKLFLDIMIKGMGATGLGWTSLVDHKDGLLALSKAIQSYMQSEIAHRNGLAGTVDLAVIQLPYNKKVIERDGKLMEVPAALSIRVGNQFRPGHIDFHNTNNTNPLDLVEYLLQRDFGLDKGRGSLDERSLEALRLFTRSMGEQAARYLDLHAIHVSPSLGNRTTKGTNIDIDSLRFVDAYHGEFKFNEWHYEGKGATLKQQTQVLKDYVDLMFDFLGEAGVNFPRGALRQMRSLFDSTFKELVADLWLLRMGLSQTEIAGLPLNKKLDFYHSVEPIFTRRGIKQMQVGSQVFYPAAYYMRGVFLNSLLIHYSRGGDDINRWVQLFVHDLPWASMKANNSILRSDATVFREAVQGIASYLSSRDELIASRVSRARAMNENSRKDATLRLVGKGPSLGEAAPYIKKYMSRHSRPRFQTAGQAEEYNRSIEKEISGLVDRGLPRPYFTQAVPNLRNSANVPLNRSSRPGFLNPMGKSQQGSVSCRHFL